MFARLWPGCAFSGQSASKLQPLSGKRKYRIPITDFYYFLYLRVFQFILGFTMSALCCNFYSPVNGTAMTVGHTDAITANKTTNPDISVILYG
jgi:hypothetical protein